MDGTNWRPVQGCNPPAGADPNAPNPAAAAGDWRAQVRYDDRTRMINMILETLKNHLPHRAGLNELQRIAVRFEERVFTTATSQPDYSGKITRKMRLLEVNPYLALGGNAQVNPHVQYNPGQGALAVLNKAGLRCSK